ncbi:hypothetical protein HK099_000115 [Clydaea vesicula]|uniref:mRNA decay factor PAT1 domain-containing protein n=1 Tax=Clydaea vesicula TaxID=447962 RepID=A0AAD5U7M8_9FUNG|nr:hypothetical protein HK099_000115 [Clydaea vesicula]KAJ3388640.1 hypothetical protein HDU92_001391 [Lobulomyces angularis]
MSFFDFNTALPPENGKEYNDEEEKYGQMDLLMEEKYKYGDELQEEEDEDNNETFGDSNNHMIDEEFDFTQAGNAFFQLEEKQIKRSPPPKKENPSSWNQSTSQFHAKQQNQYQLPQQYGQEQQQHIVSVRKKNSIQDIWKKNPQMGSQNYQMPTLQAQMKQQFQSHQQHQPHFQQQQQNMIRQQYQMQQTHSKHISNQVQQQRQHQQTMSVEELESQLLYSRKPGGPENAMSLEEVEAAMLSKRQLKFQHEVDMEILKQQRLRQQQQREYTTGRLTPPTDFGSPKQVKSAYQSENNTRQFERDRQYSNDRQQRPSNFNSMRSLSHGMGRKEGQIMNQFEKELIAKIQISQLVSQDPYTDDFYYVVYSGLKNPQHHQEVGQQKVSSNSFDKNLNWQQNMLLNNNGAKVSLENAIKTQMQRLIDGRKQQKPKGTSLSLEGALGKIALNSTKTPKKQMEVKLSDKLSNLDSKSSGKKSVSASNTIVSKKNVLKNIESVFTAVLNLEHLKRKLSGEALDLSSEMDEETKQGKWNKEYEENVDALVTNLHFTEAISLDTPHPLTHFIHYAKGKKIIPRAVRYLTPELTLRFLSTLLSRFEGLDVCHIPIGILNEEVELFMMTVIPPFVQVISEVNLAVVNNFMRILLERHPTQWLTKSKIGLATLTMLLSRAEILKQTYPNGGVGVLEVNSWTELYNFLFNSLQNNFLGIFPSFSKLLKTAKVTPTQLAQSVDQDEVYVWQFLAALAVGATIPDHQRILVIEVREKVVECSKQEGNVKALGNVNLFLNALGLGIDAAQLAAQLS